MKKPHKKYLWLVPLVVIGIVGLILTAFAHASRLPDAINMGSAHMDMSGGQTMQSIDSLKFKPAGEPLRTFTLTTAVTKRPGQPDLWTYNGSSPGPELRVTQGDHVRVKLINHLPVSTSIHWHGLSVPASADGVVGVTQDAVKPGQTYTYDFKATDDPGTYWYHSHQEPDNQIAKGLLGAFIIEPATPDAEYQQDRVLAFSNYQGTYSNGLEAWWRNLLQNIREKQSIALNGHRGTTKLSAQPGETVRLRLVNATAGDFLGKPLQLAITGAPFKVIAMDGHPLHEPQDLRSQILPIDSGQRYDIAFTMPRTGTVQVIDTEGDMQAVYGSGTSATIAQAKTFPTFDFTHYGTPAADPVASRTTFDADYPLDIGARSGFHDGELAFVDTVNGKVSPDIPHIMVKEGQVVRLRMVNHSIQAHPMHLHGHVMTVLSKNGHRLTGSPVHVDSVLLEPGESADVAFVANNPGLWMLHCHVTNHARHGLDLMVAYPNISTPYRVGRASGNIPE